MENTQKEATIPTPFERFRELTRKLIQVPKEELDAKLAEEKSRKAGPVVAKKAV